MGRWRRLADRIGVISKLTPMFLRKALEHRYLTLSVFVSMLILSIGLLAGGILRFVFFPDMTSDFLQVEMEMTDDAWHLVRNTPKVTGFVGAGKKPTPLTEEEVNQILHQSVATQEKPRPTEVFDKGERIRITDGPFASFNGVVEEVNLDRSTVKVMVVIFGRETPVELEFTQVSKQA